MTDRTASGNALAAMLQVSANVAVATVVRLIILILIIVAVVDIAVRRDTGARRK